MIAIGCLVQWYEIEMVKEYIDSLALSAKGFEDKVIIDFKLVTNQDLEKVIAGGEVMLEIKARFNYLMGDLREAGFKVNWDISPDLFTIADYRRTFNEKYCNEVEVLFWGESDMLVPSQAIQTVLLLQDSVKDTTPKWVGFFATCKMWDDSWKTVEHPKLSSLERDPYAWYGTRHYMDYDKMEEINSDVVSPDIKHLDDFKFNGCGLFFSSEIVRSGVNIPESVFFTHEDTAFMNKLSLTFSNGQIPFYVAKNILLVHNREHPKKRQYVEGESGDDLNAQRKSNKWYELASEYSKHNAYNFNKQGKTYTWEDVWNNL
tara:strand:+ start:10544 stop:11494 length:951 start_codon:yes stop_codon:yes gene_type:complete